MGIYNHKPGYPGYVPAQGNAEGEEGDDNCLQVGVPTVTFMICISYIKFHK